MSAHPTPIATGQAGADDGGAGGSSATPEPSAPRPEVEKLETLAQRIRALIDGSLETGVDPASLFQVQLDDEAAIRVEVERLRAIVSRGEAEPSSGGASGAGGSADAGAPLSALDPVLYRAQLGLDRARLAFYELPAAQRRARFARHVERQQADRDAEKERQLSAAERKGDQAEEERQRALAAARLAHTEGARLVAEEHARLLGVKKRQADFETELIQRESSLEKEQERTLRLRRRVRETIEARRRGGPMAAADALYAELRAALRPSRGALAEATRAFASGRSAAPGAGEDRLTEVPEDVDRSVAERARRKVEEIQKRLEERERQLLATRAKVLEEQVTALNADRLALLEWVSAAKRHAVTGLGPAGIDQAAAEVRQVAVVLGYHLAATLRWIAEVRTPGRTGQVLAALRSILPWLLPVVLFAWWRRRASPALDALQQGIRETDRKARRRAVGPSLSERAVVLVARVRSPLEWLALFWIFYFMLPPPAQALLEVQLVKSFLTWILGGAIAVQLVDFVAGVESERRMRRSKLQTAHLRLRSLRLISRVVVLFGLILAVTQKLVGQGTIHGWVWSFCWLAAIPVGLVLVRWWRAVIFKLVELRRRRMPLKGWVIANASGWASFPAALVGGVFLLVGGAYRGVRGWLSRFRISRRILAYLFSREIGKMAEEQAKRTYGPLEPSVHALLGPETASEKLVPSVVDQQVLQVIERIDRPGGGVFAVVGERGGGKTRLLKRISDTAQEVHLISCPFGGMEAFAPAFLATFARPPDETLEAAAARADEKEGNSGILIDDAHRLILPKMGGMRAFDRVLAIARRSSERVCWVFAFDEVIWRFFERMRGSRPLFDDVVRIESWEEEAVARLIQERSRAAGVTPDFSELLPELPADADDIDREEALARTESSYHRLIWDYAGGNPGVALQAWRGALGVGPDGTVRVRVFRPPSMTELEALPDSAVFVLRALVQLESASLVDLSEATGIGPAEVGNAIRFGLVRGYVERAPDGKCGVSWTWFRVVTRLLQRRHLLFLD